VASGRRHFEHADGTPFLWLGDTWWMGLCKRLAWPKDFKRLAADRRAKGFNVVQIIAGLYPDMPAFDPRGVNEAGFPWTRDYARINPAYFDAADQRIAHLVDSGLVPCVVGAWGYHLPWLGVERMKKHWRYLVARWGAYPVVWCAAGEGTMPYYLSKKKSKEAAFQKRGWTEIARYIRKIDPYDRLITNHPSNSARNTVEDPRVLDFDLLQTGHGDRDSFGSTCRLVRESRAAEPVMPVVNGEVCYEGILDTCFADVQRFMVWSCYLSGTAGHTYGANGIWQINRRGKPYGKSPHGGNWGTRPWDDAMKLPGSGQCALARKLLMQYPWHRFEPHPEWASFTKPAWKRDFEWGEWIWYPEGDPAASAPAETRYFRRTFKLPDKKIKRSFLRLAVDNKLEVHINGQRRGHWPHEYCQTGWKPFREMRGVHHRFGQPLLRPGKNVIAIVAENVKGPEKNPAGLLVNLEVEYADGKRDVIVGDAKWRCERNEASGWREVNFNDKAWAAAKTLGPQGRAPWGELEPHFAQFMVPYAAGIPGKVRIIYLPSSAPTVVKNLESGRVYRASHFNPITGARYGIGDVRGDYDGVWQVPEPPATGQDWVLVMGAIAR